MNKIMMFTILSAMLLMISPALACDSPTNGTEYYINANTYICTDYYENVTLVINASDIYLNGNNSILYGNSSSDLYGIETLSIFDNLNISDFNIYNYYQSIYLYTTNNTKIYNNKITDTYRGIYLSPSSSYSEIYDNNITDSNQGIMISASDYNNIYDNDIYDSNYSIEVFGSDFTSVYNNNIYTAYITGIYLYPTRCYAGLCYNWNNSIIDNYIENATGYAINADEPPGWSKGHLVYTNISGNKIKNSNIGIYTNGRVLNSFVYNNEINNSDYCYYLGSTNNTVSYNTGNDCNIGYYITASQIGSHFINNSDLNSNNYSIIVNAASTFIDHASGSNKFSFEAANVSIKNPAIIPSGDPSFNKRIGKFIEISSIGTNPIINLNFSYLDSDWQGKIRNENTLALFKYDGGWMPVVSDADASNNRVSGTITSFSTIGIFGSSTNILLSYLPGLILLIILSILLMKFVAGDVDISGYNIITLLIIIGVFAAILISLSTI